jgi:Mitochondrial genome maintenance MGM101
MSVSSPSPRHLTLALSRTFNTQAPRARLFSSPRVVRHRENINLDHTTLARRSLFTVSYQRNAEATAAIPKPSTPAPSFTQTPPSSSTPKLTVSPKPGTTSLKSGLSDQPIKLTEDDPSRVDWTSSFHGLSVEPFSKETADVLLKPLDAQDVEIKPDGIIYLPEIKYRRILNKAFGPGGWGLAPRGESIVTAKTVTREYALLAHGRYVCLGSGLLDA